MRIRGIKLDKFKKWGRNLKGDETIVNESFTNGDFENTNEVIRNEAKITWAVGKKVGFTCEGDKDELLIDIDMDILKEKKKKKESTILM